MSNYEDPYIVEIGIFSSFENAIDCIRKNINDDRVGFHEDEDQSPFFIVKMKLDSQMKEYIYLNEDLSIKKEESKEKEKSTEKEGEKEGEVVNE